MLKVGLTGSIAVGKSFVLSVLKELGCHCLNADDTAREVVAPGTAGLAAIAEAFGPEVIDTNGGLDRVRMGAIVFRDEARRLQLNSILHPLIISAQDQQISDWRQEDPNGIAVVDAALMIESGGYKRFDKLIVVHCRTDVQLDRLMKRDGFSLEEAQRRIASQMPQEQKKQFADFLIDTSDGFADTRRQTQEVFEALVALNG
jgi:dephospho-CoA kinase